MNVVGYNNRLWTNLHVINRVQADIPRKFPNCQYNIITEKADIPWIIAIIDINS